MTQRQQALQMWAPHIALPNSSCICEKTHLINTLFICISHSATHCNILQHTATHCNTLHIIHIYFTWLNRPFRCGHHLSHCSIHYGTLVMSLYTHHTATHCNTLQHTATHSAARCNTVVSLWTYYTATYCNTPTHSVTHCNIVVSRSRSTCYTATHCNTLQHTATHYNTLQRTTTHRNALQHTATHSVTHCNVVVTVQTYCTAIYCNALQHTLQHTATWSCRYEQDVGAAYCAAQFIMVWGGYD